MLMRMYGIFDLKSGSYGPPHFAASDDVAIRNAARLAFDEASMVAFAPSDFRLDFLGTFDDGLGTFESVSATPLGLLSQFKAAIVAERRQEFSRNTKQEVLS